MMNAAALKDRARAIVIPLLDASAMTSTTKPAKMPTGLISAITRPARTTENGDFTITPATSAGRGPRRVRLEVRVWCARSATRNSSRTISTMITAIEGTTMASPTAPASRMKLRSR
jgi:hypothetical protein